MRTPKGYVGTNHETIGSDVLSVLAAVNQPHSVLGPELTRRLEACEPTGWYPIGLLLEAMETLDRKVGPLSLMQMGRRLFKMSHEERVKQVATSAGDILFGIDTMYRHANRGSEIGGWKVVEFMPGFARLEKTTPHHCAMEEGILSEALKVIGIPAFVQQKHCFRKGTDCCVYLINSVVNDQRWMGAHAKLKG